VAYHNSDEKNAIDKNKRKSAIFGQLATKTVGPPLASTGIVAADGAVPATVFTVDDFKQIANQINMQEDNEKALEMLNQIGIITDTQSTSGPIPRTQFVKQTNLTAAGDAIVFEPTADQGVFQLIAADVGTFASGTNTVNLTLFDTQATATVSLDKVTSAGTEFDLNEPIYVSYPCRLVANNDAYSSGTTTVRISAIRVRG
jgi:hypothetical protein